MSVKPRGLPRKQVPNHRIGRFMDRAAGEVHKPAKDQYSPIRAGQASSIEYLL